MTLKYLYPVLVCFCLSPLFSAAQVPAAVQEGCGRAKAFQRSGNTQARPTVADSRELDYDMRYVKLDLQMDNLSTHITGMALTKAVTVAGMSDYVFELIDDYTIDSIHFNGSPLTVSTTGSVRVAALPAPLAAGSAFTTEVWYHGEPGFGPGFFTTGIRTETNTTWNQQITYTLSEPYAARDWWPCKQALGDKIDSSDVWITVPSALKAGSNGLLQQVSPRPGGLSRYEWKNRYPIDYYLISVAAGPYVDYSYYMHFTGSSDSMLVQNYIYDNPNALPVYQAGIDSTAIMINYFSELFGRYPFWKEKYGHCITPLGGGMEHQTMTTLNNFDPSLVSHELGHQWFGDHVTCGTWSDIWLNEGFATYLAYLFEAYSKGAATAGATMNGIHNSVMSQPGGTVYCDDTTSVSRIFNSRLSYNKGAAIIHSLRFVYNNDTQFFNMLKHYQQQYAYSTATTAQFRDLAAADLGQNLDTFFDQWIYKEGYPIYKAWWNQTGSNVIVRLQQTTSMPSSVALFHTPLKIKLYSATGDTIVRINNNAATEIFVFNWSSAVDSIALDPDNDILNVTDSIRRDFSLLSINGFDTTLFLLYPNPATDSWTLEGMPQRCTLALYDMSGRRLWQGNNGVENNVLIDGSLLAKGVYLLHIYKEGSADKTVRLVKTGH